MILVIIKQSDLCKFMFITYNEKENRSSMHYMFRDISCASNIDLQGTF